MRKLKAAVLSLVLIGFLFSVFYGIGTKKSWENDTILRNALAEEGLVMDYIDITERESFLMPSAVNTFERLIDTADIVACISADDDMERTIYTECTLSRVRVSEVYKGELSSGYINIFEPSYVKNGLVRTVGSYHYIQDGTKYIVFLKKIKCSLYADDGFVYIPTTTSLSKYACNGTEVTGKAYLRDNSGQEEYGYAQMAEYDMSTNRVNVLNQYDEHSRRIEEWLKGEKAGEK